MKLRSLFHASLTALWLSLPALFAASCVHEFPEAPAENLPEPGPEPGPEPDEGHTRLLLHLRYDTDQPLHKRHEYSSRSIGDTFRYIINVYDSEDDNRGGTKFKNIPSHTQVYQDNVADEVIDRDVEMTLTPGYHRVIVWSDFCDADSGDGLFYNADDFRKILLNWDGDYSANEHRRQAYLGETVIYVDKDSEIVSMRNIARGLEPETVETTITSTRPMACISFITNDIDEMMSRGGYSELSVEEMSEIEAGPLGDPMAAEQAKVVKALSDYKFRFHYAGYMPHTFNALLQQPVDAKTGISFEGAHRLLSLNEAQIGFDYVFVSPDETTVDIQVEVIRRSTGETLAVSKPIAVPIKQHHVTEVYGAFLTMDSQGQLGVDPGFFGSFDIVIN